MPLLSCAISWPISIRHTYLERGAWTARLYLMACKCARIPSLSISPAPQATIGKSLAYLGIATRSLTSTTFACGSYPYAAPAVRLSWARLLPPCACVGVSQSKCSTALAVRLGCMAAVGLSDLSNREEGVHWNSCSKQGVFPTPLPCGVQGIFGCFLFSSLVDEANLLTKCGLTLFTRASFLRGVLRG